MWLGGEGMNGEPRCRAHGQWSHTQCNSGRRVAHNTPRSPPDAGTCSKAAVAGLKATGHVCYIIFHENLRVCIAIRFLFLVLLLLLFLMLVD